MKNLSDKDKKILNRIVFLSKRHQLRPVSIVAYKRQPFYSKYDNNLRITFDTEIKARYTNFKLDVDTGLKSIFPLNQVIMEIKFNNKLPFWLVNNLTQLNITNLALSKFVKSLSKGKIFRIN